MAEASSPPLMNYTTGPCVQAMERAPAVGPTPRRLRRTAVETERVGTYEQSVCHKEAQKHKTAKTYFDLFVLLCGIMTNVTSEEPIERHERWEPIDGIETPVGSARIAEGADGLTVTLLFSQIVDGRDSDLRLKFGRVLAYTVYEELIHPWETTPAPPRLESPWERFIYPLLQIGESRWVASLDSSFLHVHPDAIHYRLLTLDQVVDVLCSNPPEVSWIDPASTHLG